jgi:hypothetical protein
MSRVLPGVEGAGSDSFVDPGADADKRGFSLTLLTCYHLLATAKKKFEPLSSGRNVHP